MCDRQHEHLARPRGLFENLFSLESEVAIVTGGLGFLGSKYVELIAAAGAKVGIFDKTNKPHPTAGKLGLIDSFFSVPFWMVDVSVKKDVVQNMKYVADNLGTPTILINNAGIDSRPDAPASDNDNGRFEDYSEKTWHGVLDSHLTGMFLMSQEFIRHFRRARESGKISRDKWGKIVNISSTYGLVSPDQSIYDFRRKDGDADYNKPVGYSVAKSGVLNFTRWLAGYCGYHKLNIRVNTLAPGGVREQSQDWRFVREYEKHTMLGRMANPDDYNGAMLFLVSEASRYMTGSTLVVDGGWTAL